MECGIKTLHFIMVAKILKLVETCRDDKKILLDSLMFGMKRALTVPGYTFFSWEDSSGTKRSHSIFQSLSLYTKIRIFLDILFYEYLSHFIVTRWMLNVLRLLVSIVDVYPILALNKFGKKYAYVEIMKSKT